jgi:tRNA(Ile)-lysidine synthase
MDPDIDRLFAGLDLADRRSLVVAVSGGSDSLSLLFLTRAFLQSHASHVRLLAVTVDHNLRPEAADEAMAVQRLCQRFGIEHRTLVWRGDKPASGLIAAAREARYDLLAEAAEGIGADVILVGHTLDDQAETVAMRAQRGAGAGLAGMARSMLFDERVWIVRPLLRERRETLRKWLTARDLSWIDDPSNDNPNFERVRTRLQLAEDGTGEGIAREAEEAGNARRAASNDAALLIDRHVTMPVTGLFRVGAEMLAGDAVDPEAVLLAFRGLLAMVGGTPYLPDVDRSRDLMAVMGKGPARVALSRVVVDRRKNEIWLVRERRNMPTIELRHSRDIWDGRWQVQGTVKTAGLQVAAEGAGRSDDELSICNTVPRSLVHAAVAGEPALFDGENFIGALGSQEARERGVEARPVVAPYARFLPDFDLALAGSLASLRGAKVVPRSPWKNHIEEGP